MTDVVSTKRRSEIMASVGQKNTRPENASGVGESHPPVPRTDRSHT